MYSIFQISIAFVLLVVNQVQSSSGAYGSNDVHQGGDKPNSSSVTLPFRPLIRKRNHPNPTLSKRAHKPEENTTSSERKTDKKTPTAPAHIATKKIASLDKPCGGPKNRQCEEGLYCVKIRDCPAESCKMSDVTHICKKSTDPNGPDPNKNVTKHKVGVEKSKQPSTHTKGDEKPPKSTQESKNPPGNSNTSSSGNSNSSGKVVLQFGWSDTDTSKVDSALKDAGIVNYERSGSSDKGLGIVVVTKEQAEAFKKYAGGSAKVFANIQEAKGGLSSTDDLKVSFKEGSDNGDIGFGDCDYGGIVTDDPSNVVSGTAKGEQKGDDALWSTENGQSAKVKMSGGGGRQYVIMKADMTA